LSLGGTPGRTYIFGKAKMDLSPSAILACPSPPTRSAPGAASGNSGDTITNNPQQFYRLKIRAIIRSLARRAKKKKKRKKKKKQKKKT